MKRSTKCVCFAFALVFCAVGAYAYVSSAQAVMVAKDELQQASSELAGAAHPASIEQASLDDAAEEEAGEAQVTIPAEKHPAAEPAALSGKFAATPELIEQTKTSVAAAKAEVAKLIAQLRTDAEKLIADRKELKLQSAAFDDANTLLLQLSGAEQQLIAKISEKQKADRESVIRSLTAAPAPEKPAEIPAAATAPAAEAATPEPAPEAKTVAQKFVGEIQTDQATAIAHAADLSQEELEISVTELRSIIEAKLAEQKANGIKLAALRSQVEREEFSLQRIDEQLILTRALADHFERKLQAIVDADAAFHHAYPGQSTTVAEAK